MGIIHTGRKARRFFVRQERKSKKKAVSHAYSYHFELKRGFEGLFFKLPSLSMEKLKS